MSALLAPAQNVSAKPAFIEGFRLARMSDDIGKPDRIWFAAKYAGRTETMTDPVAHTIVRSTLLRYAGEARRSGRKGAARDTLNYLEDTPLKVGIPG